MDDAMEYSGIKSWVEAWGGTVDYLNYVKSRGDLGVVVALAQVFWPRFVEVGGCVLWERAYEEENFNNWNEHLAGDKRRIEATLNQLRIWQIVDSEDSDDDRQALDFLAARVAKTWDAALRAEYPERHFDVWVIESEDGPAVTFCRSDVT